MIEAGTNGHIEAIVTSEMTARAIGSGELEVLATPADQIGRASCRERV